MFNSFGRERERERDDTFDYLKDLKLVSAFFFEGHKHTHTHTQVNQLDIDRFLRIESSVYLSTAMFFWYGYVCVFSIN